MHVKLAIGPFLYHRIHMFEQKVALCHCISKCGRDKQLHVPREPLISLAQLSAENARRLRGQLGRGDLGAPRVLSCSVEQGGGRQVIPEKKGFGAISRREADRKWNTGKLLQQ